ncbi:sulfatase [Persicobacter diffluens]|uniref:Heparan N-sulfatase n=1 Tax=Persicobacter diffluens TaxID=981 RepID=A0AAN4W1W4_9BACT|nr:heparan N-sulfatase [Persicobacter diffluens]
MMKVFKFKWLLFLLLTACSCTQAGDLTEMEDEDAGENPEEEQVVKRPNILLVVADDLGYEVGCYGDQQARTPNIDAFAQEATLFENAFISQASCSPSRSSILTGLFPHQNGQVGLSHLGFQMNEKYLSIPTYLKGEGYATGILGKLHIEPVDAFDFDFMCGGFDTPYKGEESNFTKTPRKLITQSGKEKFEVEKFSRMVVDMVDSAASFIGSAEEKPFFLMMNILDPHRPFFNQVDGFPAQMISHGEVELYPWMKGVTNIEGRKKEIAAFLNGTQRTDEMLGRMVQKLKDDGQYDNTLIIFIGDHGAPFDRAKGSNYEAGVRVPMIVKFPDQKAPSRYVGYTSSTDIFPTILELMNKGPKMDLPGSSFVTDRADQQMAFTEWEAHLGKEIDPRRAISTPKYKLIHHLFADFLRKQKGHPDYNYYKSMTQFELYDLENDPYEKNNLYIKPQYLPVVDSLNVYIEEWRQRTNDPYLKQERQQEFMDKITGEGGA